MARVSARTSSTGVENHLSIDRFINPYANQYITMTGSDDSKSAPATMRVRNFEPSTPRRRSANSFSRLRIRTNVSATNNRKINAESAAKTTMSWLFPGRRKVSSKAVCETRMASKTKTEIASRIITCFRCDVFCGGIEASCATGISRPSVKSPGVQVIIDAVA